MEQRISYTEILKKADGCYALIGKPEYDDKGLIKNGILLYFDKNKKKVLKKMKQMRYTAELAFEYIGKVELPPNTVLVL